MKRKDGEFLRGFACALGSLAREHDQPSVAVDIMNSNGVSLDELIAAGVESFDLHLLKKEWLAEGNEIGPRKPGRTPKEGR